MNRALALLLAGASLAPVLQAGERRIHEKQVPVPVLAAFRKAYPAAAILHLAEEKDKGQTFYEIESRDGRIRRDLSYLADGTLVEVEEAVREEELPPPVLAALRAKQPGLKILKAEKDTKGAAVSYEIRLSDGKRAREVVVDPDGRIRD